MRLRVLPLLFGAVLLAAGEDPFEPPPEVQAFARQQTNGRPSIPSKVSTLLRAFFSPPEEGGLGIVYDNAYTRTPKEVWRDRKANCLGLTALFVGACKSIGLEVRYGEPLRISRWRRVGTTVRFERHVVAVVQGATLGQELVADFLPEVRRDSLLIAPLEPKRVQALYFSNRAVELLAEEKPEEALHAARHSIEVDPALGVGWNILGVVQRAQGHDADAEASFRKALSEDPKDGAPCGNLENLLRAQGRTEEAIAYRERGLEIRKRDPFFNAFLAEEALGEQQWDEAGRRIKQAIRLLPYEPEFYWIQARVALAQGRTKDAIKSLEKARKWAQPEAQARYDSKLSLLRNIKPD
ncbi:MAG TPA: tetratricopeptide repeat protein [Geothrix sp.]|uniref:tetratricopeptide repeat protein n=1 Tax=Geothrix mesophila TaxID=2922723 RepID=UPI001FADBACA|nr:tetratricopeptide repeat protein [Geothrix sp. SG198]HJV39141.1 tetratricopeptide repeat protein [Geothrix sp.]